MGGERNQDEKKSTGLGFILENSWSLLGAMESIHSCVPLWLCCSSIETIVAVQNPIVMKFLNRNK